MKIQVTFRSGAQVEADVEEVEINKNVLSGQLRGLQLSAPDGSLRRIQHLDVTEVVAIVSIHDPSSWADRPAELDAAAIPEGEQAQEQAEDASPPS